MKTTVTKCDACEATIDDGNKARVEYVSARTPDERGDFCNLACLSEWLDKKAAAMNVDDNAADGLAAWPTGPKCSVCGVRFVPDRVGQHAHDECFKGRSAHVTVADQEGDRSFTPGDYSVRLEWRAGNEIGAEIGVVNGSWVRQRAIELKSTHPGAKTLDTFITGDGVTSGTEVRLLVVREHVYDAKAVAALLDEVTRESEAATEARAEVVRLRHMLADAERLARTAVSISDRLAAAIGGNDPVAAQVIEDMVGEVIDDERCPWEG